jgi:AhpD family alkylhydroperoxidase
MGNAPGVARIAPGTRREIGLVNAGIARLLGLATGGPPPNLFTTLARHRRLFRRWLRFAGALMPGGRLPRADSELVILRVAANCDCEYERRHHQQLGRAAGLTPEDIERAAAGPGAPGWSPRQALLLRAADELHSDGVISNGLWDELATVLTEPELIELCMLIGHYEMLAMTIRSLGIEPDPHPTRRPPRLVRRLQAATARRGTPTQRGRT